MARVRVVGLLYRQSNRGDGGVALSEFSIRPGSKVFHDFFNSRSRDFTRSSGCYRIVLRHTVMPPSTTKISKKKPFYAFINCIFKGENQRTVVQSEE